MIDTRVAFNDWVADTCVVDEEGMPLRVYRGEYGDTHLPVHSRLASISFGTREAANAYATNPNNTYDCAQTPRVMAAYLSIKKPLINNPNDPFIDFPILASAIGAENARDVFVKFGDYLYNTDNWASNFEMYESVDQVPLNEMDGLYLDLYPLLDDPSVVSLLKANGFDGAIHAGAGRTAREPEYKVFSADQIRCAWCPDVTLEHLCIDHQPRKEESVAPAEDLLAVATGEGRFQHMLG
jgi:hypothetical protein